MKLNLDSMKALYLEQLADLLNAERQLVRALPRAVQAARSPELREVLSAHLLQTGGHVERLKRLIAATGDIAPLARCTAMEGIIDDAAQLMNADGEPAVKDAALIASAQRIEHYEIAAYGCARTFALLIGREDDAELLQTTLDEEHTADQRLTDIAETSVNHQAAGVS